ncbi:hypothetical protein MMC28_003308 [Mycoblastus sanguinarius]|nr:hypothetical protein [Mycoblastus sanguinarius]
MSLDIFYQPWKGEKSGLPHDPFKSFAIPRPIGWISTTDNDGKDNLAPFSQFTNVSYDPPTVFYALREAVNSSALETWGDEFQEAGIEKAPSKLVRPPRVADSPVSFECKVHSIIRIATDHTGEVTGHFVGNSDIVIGRVVGVHVKGEYITGDGLFDVLKAAPIARNGYHQYTHINQVWDMAMPVMDDDKFTQGVLGGESHEGKLEGTNRKEQKQAFPQ